MTEQEKAQLLADWLAKPAGTPPPDGLDPDVLGAIWALRPDRAPAPRVELDEILGQVREGPFAPPPNVVPFPTRAPARRPSRWAPTLILGLAAAAAAMIVIPMAGVFYAVDRGAGEMTRASEPAFPAAAPADAPSTIPEAASPPEGTVPDVLEDAPTPARSAAARPQVEVAGGEEKGGGEGGAGRGDATVGRLEKAEAPAEPATVEPAPVTAASPEQRPVPKTPASTPMAAAPGGGQGAVTGGSRGYAADEATLDRGDDDALAQSPAPPPPSPPQSTPIAEADAESGAFYEAKSKKADAGKVAEQVQTEESATPRRRAERENRRSPAPAAASAPALKPTATRNASATPLDYDAAWYTRHADVAAVYDAARAKELAGDRPAAAGAYAALVTDARVDVAQDAAWRGAKVWRAAGRIDQALALAEQGLRRGDANTVFRANLLSLRGDLLAAAGRSAEAEAAWSEAVRLNEGR